MTLTFAFNYGGRAEIVDAVQALVRDGMPADKISERSLPALRPRHARPGPRGAYLRRAPELQLPALGDGLQRLIFTETLWPDFRRDHLFEAVAEYQRRETSLRRGRGVVPAPPR